MNCARAVVTNNSILRVGARRERERGRESRRRNPSPSLLTGEHRAAGRRRGAARTGAPAPTPPTLPSIRPSDGGRSVDQLAERLSGFRNAWTTSNRVTALRPLNSSRHPLARTSAFHFETSTGWSAPALPKPLPYAENGRRRKLVAAIKKSVAFAETFLPRPLPLSRISLSHLFGDK